MLRVLPTPFKPVLQQIRFPAAGRVNADFGLDKITRESRHTWGLRNYAAKQVCLGPVKHATCTDFVA